MRGRRQVAVPIGQSGIDGLVHRDREVTPAGEIPKGVSATYDVGAMDLVKDRVQFYLTNLRFWAR